MSLSLIGLPCKGLGYGEPHTWHTSGRETTAPSLNSVVPMSFPARRAFTMFSEALLGAAKAAVLRKRPTGSLRRPETTRSRWGSPLSAFRWRGSDTVLGRRLPLPCRSAAQVSVHEAAPCRSQGCMTAASPTTRRFRIGSHHETGSMACYLQRAPGFLLTSGNRRPWKAIGSLLQPVEMRASSACT